MKTQNNTLVFEKSSITELTNIQTKMVKGGCQWSHSSGPLLTIIVLDDQIQNDKVFTG